MPNILIRTEHTDIGDLAALTHYVADQIDTGFTSGHPDGKSYWEIEGEVTEVERATCRHCEREIVKDEKDGWVDPEADGDDRIWRETCDNNTGSFEARHEPEES